MTLTELLERERFRAVFAKRFPIPSCRFVGRMLVEPKAPNRVLVDTAFDYLLGFYLKGIGQKTATPARAAEKGLDALRLMSGKYGKKRNGAVLKIDPRNMQKGIVVCKNIVPGAKSRLAEAEKMYADAMANYERFLKGGRMPKSLLHDAIFLAKLESVCHTGSVDLSKALDNEIKDLSKLMDVAKTMDEFAGKQKCVLDTTFGKAGKRVGGTSGLLVGDTMIDINNTNNMRLTPETWYKMVGYHVLDVMDGNRHGIRNVGTYFSRYGVMKTFSVYMFGDISGFIDRFEAELEKPATTDA